MVVVKFNSKKSKEKMMSIKQKLSEKEDTKKVFINDFLGKETLSLLNLKIFVKRSELSKPKIIANEMEVDKILYEASVNQPRTRRSHTDDEELHEIYLSP